MAREGRGTLPGAEARSKVTDHFVKHIEGIPAQDDDDGVGDDGDAGEDGHDDAKEGVDEVERPVELGGVHQVAGCYIGSQAGDPEDGCGYNDDGDDLYIMMMCGGDVAYVCVSRKYITNGLPMAPSTPKVVTR